MDRHERPVLGIIGGVGPVATTNIIRTIQDRTSVTKEQDHVPILADIDSTLDSRVAAIKRGDPSVANQMVENARRLEMAGATHLLIGSNTSHYYYSEIDAETSAMVYHMPDLVGEYCHFEGYDSVMVFGTDLLCDLDIYGWAFADRECDVFYPAEQAMAMDVIYDVKDGFMDEAQASFELLMERHREYQPFVIGCTEFSVLDSSGFDTIDPVEVVADRVVSELGGRDTRI